MEVTLSEDLELEGERREIIEAIITDTEEQFQKLLETVEIDQINIDGPAEYREFYGKPMRSPGSSPQVFRHNPIVEGELQIFVQDPAHIPHEMAHQIEMVADLVEKAVENEDVSIVEYDSATSQAFSESFAYLNQLKYFSKLPEFYDVEFENLERLEEEETSWQEYEENPRNQPDLYHAAGYQAALAMHNYDQEPREMLEEPEKYRQVVEDAVAAAWIAGRNNGEIDREQYNQVVQKSVEKRLEEA